jgi:hypothetical protein
MTWSAVRAASVGLAVCAAFSACAGQQVVQDDPFGGPQVEDEILLTVHNHDVRNATVYAYWNGMKERVGTVVAMQSETFRTKWRYEEVQLGYEFVGRRATGRTDYVDGYRSELVSVTQGDHLDFIIRPRG